MGGISGQDLFIQFLQYKKKEGKQLSKKFAYLNFDAKS